MSAVGDHHAVIESTATERTSLAWRRTAFSWMAAGAAVARYFVDRPTDVRFLAGVGLMLSGGAIWIFGVIQYRRRAGSLAAGVVPSGAGGGLGLVTLTVVVAIGMTLVGELLAAIRS